MYGPIAGRTAPCRGDGVFADWETRREAAALSWSEPGQCSAGPSPSFVTVTNRQATILQDSLIYHRRGIEMAKFGSI